MHCTRKINESVGLKPSDETCQQRGHGPLMRIDHVTLHEHFHVMSQITFLWACQGVLLHPDSS